MTVEPAWRRALQGGVARPEAVDVRTLATAPAEALDVALRALADEHGPEAVPLLTALAAPRAERHVRRAARRALYRLAQRGRLPEPPPPPTRPVVERRARRAVRAWLSGIDGSGSRAAWVLFEAPFGGLQLCSLILNDTAGIVDAAGGDITKKRLARELDTLRRSQKLPWVETDPARATGLVAEALALHAARGTAPSPAFARWRQLFEDVPVAAPPPLPAEVDRDLVARGAELLELPEMAGWFLDPEAVQADAVERLEARESRLVVSEQIKTERDEAIVRRVAERELGEEARRLWARRLAEMALILDATERPEPARLARAAGAALADPRVDVRHHAFALGLAHRALDVAGEVALGRVSAAEVSRRPGAPARVSPPA